MNNVSDNVYIRKNSMVKYIHRGYIYECKRIYIYSAGFNSVNKTRHWAINVRKQ